MTETGCFGKRSAPIVILCLDAYAFHFPHRLIDLVAEDLLEAFLLQVRVVGQQVTVGGDRAYLPRGSCRDLKSCSIRSWRIILIRD